MKLLAIHDAKGNIVRLIVRPLNAPPGSTAVPSGHFATEIEVPDIKIEPGQQSTYDRLKQVMKDHRIEVKTESKLVPKGRP